MLFALIPDILVLSFRRTSWLWRGFPSWPSLPVSAPLNATTFSPRSRVLLLHFLVLVRQWLCGVSGNNVPLWVLLVCTSAVLILLSASSFLLCLLRCLLTCYGPAVSSFRGSARPSTALLPFQKVIPVIVGISHSLHLTACWLSSSCLCHQVCELLSLRESFPSPLYSPVLQSDHVMWARRKWYVNKRSWKCLPELQRNIKIDWTPVVRSVHRPPWTLQMFRASAVFPSVR